MNLPWPRHTMRLPPIPATEDGGMPLRALLAEAAELLKRAAEIVERRHSASEVYVGGDGVTVRVWGNWAIGAPAFPWVYK